MSKKSATKKKSIKEESEESEIEEYDEYEDKDEEYDEDEYDSDDSDGLEEDEEQEQEQEQEQETENETCMIDKTETNNNNVEYVSKENRSTCNRLTKYELVRILGERTKQLNMGAKPMIKNYKTLSYERIAEEELKHNMIPFKIKRPLPNGKYEIWTLDELYKEHLLTLLEL